MEHRLDSGTQSLIKLISQRKDSKDKFWDVVDTLMRYFYNHRDPAVRADMRVLEYEAAEERKSRFTKYAESGKGEGYIRRKLGVMPDRLVVALERIYEDGFPYPNKIKFYREFFRRYPKLRITDKI